MLQEWLCELEMTLSDDGIDDLIVFYTKGESLTGAPCSNNLYFTSECKYYHADRYELFEQGLTFRAE